MSGPWEHIASISIAPGREPGEVVIIMTHEGQDIGDVLSRNQALQLLTAINRAIHHGGED